MIDYHESLKNCQFYLSSFLRRHPSVYRAVMTLKENEVTPSVYKDRVVQEPKFIPKEIKEMVVQALLAGETNASISNRLGVSRASVTKIRAKTGLPGRTTWGVRRSKEEKLALAREKYHQRKETLNETKS